MARLQVLPPRVPGLRRPDHRGVPFRLHPSRGVGQFGHNPKSDVKICDSELPHDQLRLHAQVAISIQEAESAGSGGDPRQQKDN